MKKTDLAYAAGIIDGEGCIGIWRMVQHKKGKSYLSYNLRVLVTSIDQWLPNWLNFAFGGAVSYHYACNNNRQPSWQWKIVSNEALEFLRLILPYLHIKRPQAEVAIKFQEQPYRKTTIKTTEQKAVEEAQAILLHSMKSRKGSTLWKGSN